MPKDDKWCPECGCFSDAKKFKSFRCKHCVKEKGDPNWDLPRYITSKYIKTASGHFIPKDKAKQLAAEAEEKETKKTAKKATKKVAEKKVTLIEDRKKPRKKAVKKIKKKVVKKATKKVAKKATKKTARKKVVKKAKKK